MSLVNKPELILPHMIENARELLATIESMAQEYEANGLDSLANMDFGAYANANIARLTNQMQMLDEAGMFTMGLEEEEA